MIHLDTSFLVDLLRETGRNEPGRAARFLGSLDDDEVLGVSVHVLCELEAGAELSRKPQVEQAALRRVTSGLEVVYPDDRFAPAYGRLLAALERIGQRIATMDLLIATAAILEEASLVTGNAKHFARVPGLRVRSY